MSFTWHFWTGKKTPGVFIHLLPRGRPFRMVIDRPIRQFFEALSNALVDITRDYFDQIFLDMFPQTTRELTAWELQWGLPDTGMTTQARRDRLAGRWAAQGGQSPRYIQDTLQGAGFDVYVHEWWIPGSDPPIARNPNAIVNPGGVGCGEPIAECGEPIMECGADIYPSAGRLLVNKLYNVYYADSTCCGEPLMECGEPGALGGEYTDVLFLRQQYDVPSDPNTFPYFLYIGGAVFGTQADIDAERVQEFEDLCLQICPAQHWIVLMLNEI
jgi:hypothetical protein